MKKFSPYGLIFISLSIFSLPNNFVYLKDIDPSIIQDMRYTTDHNFVGRPIKGYIKPTCILTKPAAIALSNAQKELLKSGYSLKVYDCYRPQMASNDFLQWSKNPHDEKMKAEFYPAVPKDELFKRNYIAAKSGHTRGSTMDLTIVKLPAKAQEKYVPGQKLMACTAPYDQRFKDNSIDMGTGFDCMDPKSWPNNKMIAADAYKNRMLLRNVMVKNGFVPYAYEWWHFTLKNEPYPNQYFNFEVK